MKVLYIDSTTTLTLDEAKTFIDDLHNFSIIGNGTYCTTSRISKQLVLTWILDTYCELIAGLIV